MLFPAVQCVREAATRMACSGNFCYLGVALHSYADAHGGAFPAGTWPHPLLPPEQRLSWIVALLPHFDQDREFQQFDLTRGPREPENATATANRFRVLVEGTTQPSQASVQALVTTVQTAAADGIITSVEVAKITKAANVVLAEANIPPAEIQAVVADLQAIAAARAGSAP